jgi:hypothetical protein
MLEKLTLSNVRSVPSDSGRGLLLVISTMSIGGTRSLPLPVLTSWLGGAGHSDLRMLNLNHGLKSMH